MLFLLGLNFRCFEKKRKFSAAFDYGLFAVTMTSGSSKSQKGLFVHLQVCEKLYKLAYFQFEASAV